MRNESSLSRPSLSRSWVAMIGLVCPVAASAHNWSYGFVWADSPSSASYTPDAYYAYSDAGNPPRIERSQTGKYTVNFPGMSGIHALEANVQVTAYGTSSDYCKAQSWSGDTITVLCFDATGDVVDTLFSVLYLEQDFAPHTSLTPPDLGPTDVGRYAFALATQPANPSYAPHPSYASNPGGGAITATRTGTGAYTITFAGMFGIGTGGGHAQVTAYGAGSARCRVRSWGNENVNVRCFDASGAPADSAYSVLYWRTDAGDPGVAYAWAGLPTTASYTPDANYSFNASGGTLAASRTSTGSYGMLWNGMSGIGVNGGNVQVAAYDSGGADVRCKVASWSGTSAFVRCFDTAGNPVDSAYTVLFLKTPKKPWAREYAYAHAGIPSTPSYHPYAGQSHNAVGGHDFGSAYFDPRTDIEITRSGVGIYEADFEGFRAYPGGGNVQVVSTDASASYCHVGWWSEETAEVRCFDATGSPRDSSFTVFYLKAPAENTSVAYAWAGSPTLASYTPAASYAHNPAGGAITATRSGTGLYAMVWSGFSGLAAGGGHPQVTAYGASNRRCQIQFWGGDSVLVRCFDSAGNLADSAYSILYLRPAPEDDGLAFTWADQPSVPGFYTPNPLYSFNAGNDVRAYGHGVGDESVEFLELEWRGVSDGTNLITGYGLSDNRCRFSNYGINSLTAACFDAAGNPFDTRLNALRVEPVAVPEPGHVAMLASGIALTGLFARRRSRQERAL